MNFNGSNTSFGYNNNRNRSRNNNRRNNNGYNGNNNNNGGKKFINSPMLPKWYRNAFFKDCSFAVRERSYGDMHAIELAEIRSVDEPSGKDDRRPTTKNQNQPKKETSRRFEAPDTKAATPESTPKEQPKHQEEAETLRKFIGEYGGHIADINYLKRLIIEMFPDVLRILRKYGDDRYVDLYNSMDKVFTLMCTSQLSSLILSILEENGFPDWDNDWKNLAVAISIIMSNYGNRINNTGAKSCYVNDIIPCGAMWKKEITSLVEDYKITREMAMDLVMKIPVLAEDMRTWDLNQYFIGFEWCIMAHGHDNMEVLDAELQGKLFDFFFNGPNNLAPKALSRFLAAPPVVVGEEDEVSTAISSAFRQMLYEKLDQYDIDEIERTLRYVIKERKRYETEGKTPDISLYCAAEALQFENVAKAINNLVENDENAKQYLA